MFAALPGQKLIETGLDDLRHGRETVAALIVAIGAPRLRRLGHALPDVLPAEPEHRLYAQLDLGECLGIEIVMQEHQE
jgi:hypothetical protein